MAFARDVYTATGGQTDFTISFPYLDDAHVTVSQNGTTLTEVTHYTFPNATTVRLVTGATAGDTVVLKRATSPGTRLVDYTAGVLVESDLDTDSLQGFYLAQESSDTADLALGLDNANNWDAENKRITNVAEPTALSDAATKSYVDTRDGARYDSEEQTATASQTVFTLTSISYEPGIGNLSVYINGVRQAPSAYTETSGSVVTFTSGLTAGDLVQFVSSETTTTTVTSASNVTYNPGGTGSVQTNVQDKLREIVSLRDFGATGDGVTDDTTAINNFAAVTGVRVIPDGNYASPGGLSALSEPDVMLSSAATLKGSPIPFLNITATSLGTLPNTYGYIRQDTSDRGSPTTFRVDRIVDSDDALANPKAIQGYTKVNTDTAQTEWAISGELDNYSDTSSTGNTALSGVSNKYGAAPVFGLHTQAKEWVVESVATDVKSIIGMELNTPAVGLDHPTSNNNLGNRFGIDLIARTNEQIANWNTVGGNDGDAEIGVGLRIRTDAATDGYFRYGLVIDDVSQSTNPNPITTAALIRTSGADGLVIRGANTAANLRIGPDTHGSYGLVIEGAHSIGAIRVDTGSWIGMSTDGSRKMRYSGGTDSIEFYNGANERFAFRLNATPIVELNNTQVITVRQTGWTDQTATASRADLGASPTVGALASFCRALYDDLKSHGLIGN